MWKVGELSNITRQACSSNDGTEVLLEALRSLVYCGAIKLMVILVGLAMGLPFKE